MLRIRFYFKPEELQCLAELQTEQPKPRKVEGLQDENIHSL